MIDELDQPYPIDALHVEFIRLNGFVKLRQVLSAQILAKYGGEITRLTLELNTMRTPLEERGTYDRAFLQVMNLWKSSPIVERFVRSRRLAYIATELLGVNGVRLYHDQSLYKEPSGGYTPAHADQYYWPLASDRTVTAWIPLQAVPAEMGPLAFYAGSHVESFGRDLPISDESEQRITKTMETGGFSIVDDPFELGDVSFHLGWTFHRAGPNLTTQPRSVMTIIYMDQAMRLVNEPRGNQKIDWERWCPGAVPGERIATPLNPVLYSHDIRRS